MSGKDAFDRVLQALHAAAFDDALWPAASGLIDELVGIHGSLLAHADGTTPDTLLFAQICARGERDRELERVYYRDYHHRDERLPRIRLLPDGQPARTRALSTDEERRTSAIHNELLPRVHAQDGLNVRLDGPGGSVIVWSAADPVDRDGWTSGRVRTVRRLLPHLRHFVTVRHALLRARALDASLEGLFDSVRAGVMQLDRRARLVRANSRAEALLDRRDGLRHEDGLVRAALPREDAALQRLLARALPSGGGPGEGGTVGLGRPGTPSRLVLHVSPVHDPGIESGRGRVGALLLAVDPADRTAVDPGRAGEALGLTPAESRVAVALAQGRTMDDIAAEAGRSRATVKWHVRNVYAKLGVSSRFELARLVTSLAGLPGARG